MPEEKQPGHIAYTGAPTVRPETPQGLPQINLTMPHIQFTDAIGRGMQALGHSYDTLGDATRSLGQAWSQAGNMAEKTGNELFARAIAQQQITNETATNEAMSAYDIEQGMADENFTQLKGNNAAGQLKKHLDDTKERRDKFRASLANDAQRRHFDSQSLGVMGRSVRAASSHAGVEQRNAYIRSLDADVANQRRQVDKNPWDDDARKEAETNLEKSITKKHQAMGDDPEVAKVEIKETIEKIRADQLTAQSRERPFQAWENFQAAKERGEFTSTIADQLEHTIMDAARQSGARNAADAVMKDYLSGKPDTERGVQERYEDAKRGLPDLVKDDPETLYRLKHNIETYVGEHNHARQQDLYNSKNYIMKLLQGDGTPGGAIPGKLDDLLADPRFKSIWDGADPVEKRSIQDMIYENNVKGMRVDQEISDQRRRFLFGMSQKNPQEFLKKVYEGKGLYDKDIMMNKGDRDHIRGIAEKMMKDPTVNPLVNKAFTWMTQSHGPELDSLGLTRRTKDNELEWFSLHGAIAEEVLNWIATKGKEPTREEFQKQIAPHIIEDTTRTPGMFGWSWGPFGTDERYWQKQVPEDFSTKYRNDELEKGRVDVPESEIRQEYTKELFRQSLESRKAKTPKTPNVPRPPSVSE